MYKNRERKLNHLLDRLLVYATEKDDLSVSSKGYEIYHFLRENKGTLSTDIQKKILQILSVSHSYILLEALQSKEYQHLGCEVVKLLDLSYPYFSYNVIETLYKMGTYEFVDEIRPFSTLSIDDKMPNKQISYRDGWEFYSGFPLDSFEWLNDQANKYIKKAGKLKDKHTKV